MNRLLSFVFVAITAVATNFFAQRVMAQAAPAALTVPQVGAIKALVINNLEKDTYLKTGGYILERYQDRPAYVFAYSDGISRKVYLYTVYGAADTKPLGLLAIYLKGNNERKAFVVPGAAADRPAWDLYLDDLKYIGEKEPGLMPALSFVLSRELATLLSGDTGQAEGGAKKKDEYNFCFAPMAPVLLADGTTRPINELREGDDIMGYSTDKQMLISETVLAVQTHTLAQNQPLVGIWTLPTQTLTASNVPGAGAGPTLLEATHNHPILTATGPKPLGQIAVGETVFSVENGLVRPARVVRAGSTGRADIVYSLRTTGGSYVVHGTVVLDK